ncbi:MAG: hypothetical protein SCM96_15550 [Acidobacteriota bacterium]|nr:hypothetical protein [Acidobacteriota bacterium]
MKIGGRVGFDRIEDLEKNFRNIDFPIELALPWRYTELWLPMADSLAGVISFLMASTIRILSIHATQGNISDEAFLFWGRQTVELARELGVQDITIHPGNCRSRREASQQQALRNIRRIERETGAEGIFSVETFGGKNRVLKPEEIISFGLPMTLDTAHLHDRNEIMEIVDGYRHNIKTVHLSTVGEGEHHLPVDAFCLSVVDRLRDLNWEGNVILEYLPWFHFRVRADVRALSAWVERGIPVELIPPDDRFRGDPARWGYGEDGR